MKTRFSPSPTGLIHIGNARAALFSALLAAKEQGIFLLRIEDTDLARSEEKFTAILQADLRWLGIEWQEGPDVGGPNSPYYQSQRHAIYDEFYHQLEKNGRAYPCFCSEQTLAIQRKLLLSRGQAPRYPGTCRSLSQDEVAARLSQGLKPALRFRVLPDTVVSFVDLVKGEQRFNSDDIGDFIIRRAEGTASFMFCNAIDDSLMGVTHVLRGEDHLANTPRQLMILTALDMRAAQYGHLSLITGDDGAPLSKRHGSFSLHDLREQGYLSQAVLNYLSRLSHNYESQHLMSFAELAEYFRVDKLSRAPARFDNNQLLYWQKETVLRLSDEGMRQWLQKTILEAVPADKQELFIEVMRKNILFPTQAMHWAKIFFDNDLVFTNEQETLFKQTGEAFFTKAMEAVDHQGTDIKAVCERLKTELNVSGKKLFMPVRVALTGENNGPELLPIATLMGAEKIRQRFKQALELAGQ